MKPAIAFLALSTIAATTANAVFEPDRVPPGYVLYRCEGRPGLFPGLLLVGSDDLIMPGDTYPTEHRQLSTGVLVFDTGSFKPVTGELRVVVGDRVFRRYCTKAQVR